jgi:hypothetical protein
MKTAHARRNDYWLSSLLRQAPMMPFLQRASDFFLLWRTFERV